MKPIHAAALGLLLVTHSAHAAVTCKAVNSRGGKVVIVFTHQWATVQSEHAEAVVRFPTLLHSWDGHNSGILIGRIPAAEESLVLAIHYNDDFNFPRSATIFTSVATRKRSGHLEPWLYEVLDSRCTGRF